MRGIIGAWTPPRSSPLLVGVILGVVVGGLTAWSVLSRSVSAERIRAAQAEGALAALRADNESLRALQGSARSLEDLLQPVRDSLDTLRRASDQAGRERTAAEATITTQITAVQERYQSLETTTRQLAAALARGQTRGQWGEMQLEGLLEHAGLLEGTHFVRQDSRVGDPTGRPDPIWWCACRAAARSSSTRSSPSTPTGWRSAPTIPRSATSSCASTRPTCCCACASCRASATPTRRRAPTSS